MERESLRLSRLRLGEILVARRLVTQEQVGEALRRAESGGGRLGDALMALGYLSEVDLRRSLATQLGLPFEPGLDLELDLAVARQISERTAHELQALPIRLDGPVVIVALNDPLNSLALDHIALKTGKQARPLVVTTAAVQRAIVKAFGLPDMNGSEGQAAIQHYDLAAEAENPTVKLVNTLLTQAIARRASDIHIEPFADQVRVRFRVDGALVEVTPLPLSRHAGLISRLKVMAGMDIAERRIPQDGQVVISHQQQQIDLRVNTVPTMHGERLVIRLLRREAGVRGLEQLGMPAPELRHFREMIGRPNGLILVTGPTGSGKSTTLMSTLSTLNRGEVNILTIEDPVEYRISGIGQVQANPRAGLTFSSGLRAFLRQDPDIIMIGEIRDAETADIAVRAAMTGHLVLSTLHTNQAAGAVGRLTDIGIESFLLASSLLGVVAQRLVRVLCHRCKQPVELAADSPVRLLPGVPEGKVTFYRPRGCGFCDQLGYRGRQAIFEVLPVTARLRELIAERAPIAAIQREALAAGVTRTLWETGLERALEGLTSLEEVQKVAFAEA